jgi:hypothetical protein
MDLTTIKEKMDRDDYSTAEEFLADINQITTNCFTYWTQGDAMWIACEKFKKTFDEQYSKMDKWISKMSGVEKE